MKYLFLFLNWGFLWTQPLISQESIEVFSGFYGQGVFSLADPELKSTGRWSYPTFGDPSWFRQVTGLSLETGGDFWEIKAQGQVLWNGKTVEFHPGILWIQGDWDKTWFLRLGYQAFSKGPGRLLDLWPQPAAVDPSQFLAWGGREPDPTEPALNLRGVLGNLTLEAFLLPFLSRYIPTDPRSPWFFRRKVPSTFEVTGLGTYNLNTLAYLATEESFWAPTVLFQGRWSMNFIEIQMAYITGLDWSPPLNAEVSIPGGNDFNLTLHPLRKQIQQGVMGIQGVWKEWELWTEGKVTAGRPLILKLTPTGLSIPITEEFSVRDQPVMESAGGLTWRFASDWELTMEAKGWWTGNWDDLEIPDYSRSWSGSLGWHPASLPWNGTVVVLGSFQGFSGLGVLNLGYLWSEGVEIWAQFPVFWGDSGSEWGQFSQKTWGQIGWKWLL